LGGALLVIVVAVAGYIGIKLKSKPSVQPTSPTTAQVEQPAQPPAAPPETTAPAAAEPAKGKTTPKAGAAKPRPEASVATGDLHVTTTPPGATINVDGKDQGQTPATLKLKEGQHAVVVSLDGYKAETRHPDITVGQRTNMTAVLTATAGFMMISSNPPGADIVVDGKPTGSVTPSKIKVPQGQHTFAVRKQGAKEQVMSAFVLAGQTLPLDFTLPVASGGQGGKSGPVSQNVPPSNLPAATPTPAPNSPPAAEKKESSNPFRKLGKLFGSKEDSGRLEIRSTPKGAEILVNGNPTGKKTPVKTDSAVGAYTITLQLDGYKPVTRKIQITKGQTTGIDETLEKQ